ncbi:MAG TPA: hypothetical protein PKW45_12720 [Bryobacteraceae bacterium]|nr:hypothetical protein [Bryobacteraceae bacterium]
MLIATLLLIALALWLVHWVTNPERRSLTLTAARLLRRAGRWLWAAGEGLEHGFLHSQQVKRQISLDLEARP